MYLLAQETRPRVDDIRFIPLSRGLFAIVSGQDYEWLMQWKWHAHWNSCTKSYYAVRHESMKVDPKRTIIWMHRLILGLGRSVSKIGDHINRNTLDNTRTNLRITNKQGNAQNRCKPVNNSTGLKGVSESWKWKNGQWNKNQFRGWRAQISHAGKNIYIGHFKTRELAHAAYCDMARKLNGEFARNE